jgi:hypothetical protein
MLELIYKICKKIKANVSVFTSFLNEKEREKLYLRRKEKKKYFVWQNYRK